MCKITNFLGKYAILFAHFKIILLTLWQNNYFTNINQEWV